MPKKVPGTSLARFQMEWFLHNNLTRRSGYLAKPSLISGVVFAAFVCLVSVSEITHAAASCSQAISFLGQPDMVAKLSLISSFPGHRVIVLEYAAQNQVVVLLGERHNNNPIFQREYIHNFLSRFPRIALEWSETSAAAIKNNPGDLFTSSLWRALSFQGNSLYSLHFIDQDIPFFYNPNLYSIIPWLFFGASIMYWAASPFFAFTIDYGQMIFKLKLMDAHRIFSLTPWLFKLSFASLIPWLAFSTDSLIGAELHQRKKFELARFLPVTRFILNQRSTAMVQKIADIMRANENGIMATVVGSGHLPQMVHELEQLGFRIVWEPNTAPKQ